MLLCYGRQSRVKHCITVLLNDLGLLTLYIFSWYKVKAWEYKGKGKWKPSQEREDTSSWHKGSWMSYCSKAKGLLSSHLERENAYYMYNQESSPRGQGWPICHWADGEEKEKENQSTEHRPLIFFFFESTKLSLLQVTFNDMTLQQFQDKQFILQEVHEVWDPLMTNGMIP